MAPLAQLKITTEGAICVLALNRPESLNALGPELLSELENALNSAYQNPEVKTIWLESTTSKTFCAGGDVKLVAEALTNPNAGFNEQYFLKEYDVDLMIEQSPKPIVTYSEGITFGGGWGLFAGGNLRLASETARFAMPENQIGFFPDVGAAHFLQSADWRVGTFLALSGIAINALDAVALDLLDGVVAKEYAQTLKTQLAHGVEVSELAVPQLVENVTGQVNAWRNAVELLDKEATLTDWLQIIADHPEHSAFQQAYENLRDASPWTVAFTWHYFSQARDKSRAEVLAAEKLIAALMAHHPDFYEGVSAKLIDKNRRPNWQHQHVEEVSAREITNITDKVQWN